MLIKHPAFEGVTVYVISREAVFARMLELELRDVGLNAVRTDSFPVEGVENGEIRVFTVSSDVMEANPSRSVQIEFGFADEGTDRAERYFKRPFSVDDFIEAVAEIALLRRGEEASTAVVNEPVTVQTETAEETSEAIAAGLDYNSEASVFSYNGDPLTLTETEFSLLSLLYERRGETVTREEILSHVWGREENENVRRTNLTDVYIRYLREKIDDRFDVRLIVSVRGKGYMLR